MFVFVFVFVWFFFLSLTCSSCAMSWLQCAQFPFLSFSQLNISEPELIFKYHRQWFIRLVLTFPQLCCFSPNKTSTTVKSVWMSNAIKIAIQCNSKISWLSDSRKRSVLCNLLHHYNMSTYDHLSLSPCTVIYLWDK